MVYYKLFVQVYCKWVENMRNEHLFLQRVQHLKRFPRNGRVSKNLSDDGIEEVEMEFSQLIEPLIMEMNLICFYGSGI